jgi:hypothetical protein
MSSIISSLSSKLALQPLPVAADNTNKLCKQFRSLQMLSILLTATRHGNHAIMPVSDDIFHIYEGTSETKILTAIANVLVRDMEIVAVASCSRDTNITSPDYSWNLVITPNPDKYDKYFMDDSVSQFVLVPLRISLLPSFNNHWDGLNTCDCDVTFTKSGSLKVGILTRSTNQIGKCEDREDWTIKIPSGQASM